MFRLDGAEKQIARHVTHPTLLLSSDGDIMVDTRAVATAELGSRAASSVFDSLRCMLGAREFAGVIGIGPGAGGWDLVANGAIV